MLDTAILKSEEKALFDLRSLYRSFGYIPYKMSKFEEYEYYIRNKDFLVSDRFITFNDTNGKLMALKPDVTLSIIKNSQDTPGCKQKVYYNENIYRISDSTRQFKEIMQAGLECIGDIDLYDIYEAVYLAGRSLALLSDNFVIQISHQGILSAVLDDLSPDSGFRQEVTACIAQKNAHDLLRLCERYGISSEKARMLTGFIHTYGDRRAVLAQLRQICCDLAGEPLDQLEALSRLLDATPFPEKFVFDFSVVNNMNYYNGIVFKGFLSGVSGGILAGGQYDKLMRKMDRRCGAIGFAVYLDLLEQLPDTRRGYDVDVLLVYETGTDPAAVAALVQRMASEGKTVSAQRAVPPKLRCREILRMSKEGTVC